MWHVCITNLIGVVMLYSTYMDRNLSWLRWQARKVAVLGNELGVENKTEAEIAKETDDLVVEMLVRAIRKYDPDFSVEPYRYYNLPETLNEYLWHQIRKHICMQTGMSDVDDDARKLLDKELEQVSLYIKYAYERRHYNLTAYDA